MRKRKQEGWHIYLEYTIKFNMDTEFEWSKKMKFFDERLTPIFESFSHDIIYEMDKERAIKTFKYMTMRDIKRWSPTAEVAIRWDEVSAYEYYRR